MCHLVCEDEVRLDPVHRLFVFPYRKTSGALAQMILIISASLLLLQNQKRNGNPRKSGPSDLVQFFFSLADERRTAVFPPPIFRAPWKTHDLFRARRAR